MGQERADTAATAMSATDVGDVPDGDASDDVDGNLVRVVGRVSSDPERRTLPSGDEVVSVGLSVRRPEGGVDAVPVQVGPAPPAGQRARAGQQGRRVLSAAERLRTGDRIEVTGQLRRRWWAAGGGRRSRLEVRADTIERR